MCLGTKFPFFSYFFFLLYRLIETSRVAREGEGGEGRRRSPEVRANGWTTANVDGSASGASKDLDCTRNDSPKKNRCTRSRSTADLDRVPISWLFLSFSISVANSCLSFLLRFANPTRVT